MNQPSVTSFHKRLRHWYQVHGRKGLPWRDTCDPYHIYISEIMLQQTQVKTVLERYYFPFLKRFPSLGELAKAKQQDVLSAWQGLGYYNRAVNLHKAAKACGGNLPSTTEQLLALPGIGKNTAHAIAAFAYHQPVAVMEANVKRVICRVFALAHPSTNELWEKAQGLLDKRNPFDYNQAMMDLGSMICTAHAPKCKKCPANNICRGKTAPEHYPASKYKKAPPVRRKTIIVYQNSRGECFAVPRKTRFLNGLYHFHESEAPPKSGRNLGHIRQQYSHFTLEANIYLASKKGSGKHWYTLKELGQLPFSMAEKKIIKLLS